MIGDIFNAYRDAFRQWVRTKTKAKSVLEAEEKRLFWSKCYLLSVLSAVGVFIYQLATEHSGKDRTIPTAVKFSEAMKESDQIRILKYRDFTRVSDEKYSVKDLQKGNF